MVERAVAEDLNPISVVDRSERTRRRPKRSMVRRYHDPHDGIGPPASARVLLNRPRVRLFFACYELHTTTPNEFPAHTKGILASTHDLIPDLVIRWVF